MQKAKTIGCFLREAVRFLLPSSDTPDLDAQCLLSFVLKRDRTYLITWPDHVLTPLEQKCAQELVARRRKGEPVAYLVGKREFYGRDFEVNRSVLIPRPETELLVETALDAAGSCCRVADLGTGSGCILVTLLAERPEWSGIGADISAQAIEVAARNAAAHGVLNRACFVRADFTASLFCPHSLDVIVSNPPYISGREYVQLMPDVRCYEPASALVPYPNLQRGVYDCVEDQVLFSMTGLEHLEAIERMARYALKPGGILVMEMGYEQGAAMSRLFAGSPECWSSARVLRDFAGLDRVIVATHC